MAQPGNDYGLAADAATLPDLTILVSGWLKVDSDPLFDSFIAADFNHAFEGKDKNGSRKHITLPDLTILVNGWLKTDAPGNPAAAGTTPCPGTL